MLVDSGASGGYVCGGEKNGYGVHRKDFEPQVITSSGLQVEGHQVIPLRRVKRDYAGQVKL